MAENQIVTGHFEADGALINLPIGFVPDHFRMWDINGTSSVLYEWWYDMELDGAAAVIEGLSITIAAGASAIGDLASGEGISAYGARTDSPTVSTWTTDVATAATARTATAPGTYVKPSTSGTVVGGQSADRSLIFECVTAGTGGSTEPVWPIDGPQGTSAGGQVTDNSVVWERVVEPTFSKGYSGVTIAAALMTDGQECYYKALRANTSKDLGDVDGWTDGISPEIL